MTTPNSGVPNILFNDGCTTADLIRHIGASSNNHGDFIRRTAQYLNSLKKVGLITEQQKAALMSCAGNADIP